MKKDIHNNSNSIYLFMWLGKSLRVTRYMPLNFESKKTPLSSLEKKQWHLLDLTTDSIPGMSVERAYKELIKEKKRCFSYCSYY